jgi:hypothetical protein
MGGYVVEQTVDETFSDQRKVLAAAALLDACSFAEICQLISDQRGVTQRPETDVVIFAECLGHKNLFLITIVFNAYVCI